MDISNKTVIVTGGASGIGRATVEMFASQGAKVAIFDRNNEQGEALSESLGNHVQFFQVDVTSESSVKNAIDAVVENWSALHIVTNFAGIAPGAKIYGKSGLHSLDLYQQVIAVNQIGTFNVCRLAVEKIIANDSLNEDGLRGVIINTASIAAFEGQIGQVAYAASKGAIVSMTLPMARELATFGIRVNTIAPGLVYTPLCESLPTDTVAALAANVPFPKRLGKSAEMASLVRSIVENDYMNGEVIRCDGAIRMQPR